MAYAVAPFTSQRPIASSTPRHQCQSTRQSSIAVQAAAGTHCSRRGAVAGLLALPALALQLASKARAEEAAVFVAPTAPLVPVEPVAAGVLEAGPWKNYVGREFRFTYPPTLKLVEEDIFASVVPDRPRSTLDVPVDNPVKAQLFSADGTQQVSVVVRLASNIKPTFFQLTDISQWGTIQEVAKLLLPPGATVTNYSTLVFPQPPKNGPFGKIERDPLTLYRYSVLLPDQGQVAMTVGAQKGQIYVLGASATKGSWDAAGEQLTRVADSFRLVLA